MASSKQIKLAVKIAGKVDSSYSAAMRDASSQISNFATQAKNAIKALGIGVAAYKGIQAAGRALRSAAEDAMEFESSMADVAKVVDGLRDKSGNLTEEYDEMKQSLLDLSTQIPMTANELAQIAAAAGQANVARDEIAQFTEDAAKMGVAFDTTADQAGEWMAQWRTAFQINQDEVTELADQINYLGNHSSTSAAKIASIVTQVGAIGVSSGFSVSELAAMGDVMSSVGVDESSAATAIAKLSTVMTSGASATARQQKVLKKLGFSATEMAERMTTDAQGAVLDLLGAIKQLPEAERNAALKDYFGQQSIKAIAPLYRNLDELKKHFNEVGDASLYAGSMEDEFAVRSDTTENKIQLAKNSLQRLSITIGDMFLPYIGQAADAAAKFLNKLTEFQPQIEAAFAWIMANGPEIATTVAAIGTALGGLWAAGKVGSFLDFGKMFTRGIAGGKKFTDILGKLPTVLAGLNPNAIGPRVDPLTFLFGKKGANATKAMSAFKGSISGYFKGIGSSLKGFSIGPGLQNAIASGISRIKNAPIAQAIGNKISTALSGAGGLLSSAGNLASVIGGEVSATLIDGIGKIKGTKLVSGIGGVLGKVGGALGGGGLNIFGNLGAAASTMSAVFGPVTSIFGTLLSGALPIVGVISSIIAVVSILGDNLGSVRDAIGNTFGPQGLAVFDGAMAAIQGVGDKIKEIFSPANLEAARQAIVGIFGEGGGAAFDGIVQIVQSVIGVIQQLVTFSTTYVKPIIQEIFTFITGTVLPGIMTAFSTVAPYISTIISGLGTAIMSVATMIAQGIQAVLPVIEFIIFIIQGLLAAFQVAAPAIMSVIASISSSIMGFVGGLQTMFQGLIDFITGVFTGNWQQAWEGVKQIFSGAFEALVELCKAPINAVISIINGAIAGLNSISIDIPEWVPVIGGGHFGVDLPTIPMLARGGDTRGPSIAGEAGMETVISYASQYRDQNVGYWQQAGQRLGVLPDSDNLLYFSDILQQQQEPPQPLAFDGGLGGSDGGDDGTDGSGNGGGGFTYAPTVIIQGNADQQAVENALRVTQAEFEEMYNTMQKKHRRTDFERRGA